MAGDLLQAAGGIGLFLLGMVLLTEGLRAVAGDALERSLRRFTNSPLSGAVSGMVATAIVQSSSAITVTAVGFAGAAILTFPQALGIVFGANLGTTVSGWLVALLGFRVHIGAVASVLVLAGALLRLFGRGRARNAGIAVAGFGVVFVGFVTLQQGMAGFEGLVTPESFPADTLAGRLLLVGIGIGITLVTQSSSAGIATAIAAVGTGAISLPQALALVIGMDVGTTVTAVIATIGASLPARRTGFAHVIYNVFTGAAAFFLLPVYAWALARWLPDLAASDPQLALVGFHTGFNLLGVVAVLPVAGPFARLVERLVPARGAPLAGRLDAGFLDEPAVALRAVGVTLSEIAERVFLGVRELMQQRDPDDALMAARAAVEQTRRYLARIPTPGPDGRVDPREIAALHTIDQLRRLLDRCEQRERLSTLASDRTLRDAARRVDALLGSVDPDRETALETLEEELRSERQAFRRDTIENAGRDALPTGDALLRLDAYHWLQRVTHHAWRIVHHLARLRLEHARAETAGEPPEPD